jgi:hypothetical protein
MIGIHNRNDNFDSRANKWNIDKQRTACNAESANGKEMEKRWKRVKLFPIT